MKKLLLLLTTISAHAADIDPKKTKIPPPPKTKKRFIPSDIETREKLVQIRAMLNAELGKKKPA